MTRTIFDSIGSLGDRSLVQSTGNTGMMPMLENLYAARDKTARFDAMYKAFGNRRFKSLCFKCLKAWLTLKMAWKGDMANDIVNMIV